MKESAVNGSDNVRQVPRQISFPPFPREDDEGGGNSDGDKMLRMMTSYDTEDDDNDYTDNDDDDDNIFNDNTMAMMVMMGGGLATAVPPAVVVQLYLTSPTHYWSRATTHRGMAMGWGQGMPLGGCHPGVARTV